MGFFLFGGIEVWIVDLGSLFLIFRGRNRGGLVFFRVLGFF